MTDPKVFPSKVEAGNETVIVFLHGFLGEADKTWGRFPEFLGAEPALEGWDIYCVGYETSLFSYLPFWRSDPDIPILAEQLETVIHHAPFDRYRQVAIIAHSMGGLVAQRALVDSAKLQASVGHLLMYGTPSGGLESAKWFRLFKRQVASMTRGGPFIEGLRRSWDEQFADPTRRPFKLKVVGGELDMFVPEDSWRAPFHLDDCDVARGDHTQIVKPESPEDLSVQIAIKTLVGDAAPGGPWSSARLALEMGEFREAVEAYEPHAGELDDGALVDLALALERMGRSDDAVAYLSRYAQGTDARGTLAGRLKRAWYHDRRRADGERALELYQQGFDEAVRAGDREQASYLGINVAFLQAVFARDADAARATAQAVVEQCSHRPPTYWPLVTAAEAHLHEGDMDAALRDFAAALKLDPEPWKVQSTYQQAVALSEVLELPIERLEHCFRDGWAQAGNE